MNAAHEHERHADDIGAYLLGALEESEERSFENHLDTCPVCQEEVERLTLAVDALPASVDQLAPPPELRASLMATVRADAAAAQPAPAVAVRERAPRRNWRELFTMRPAFAGALAATLLAIGIAVGLIVGGTGGDDGGTTTHIASVDTGRLANNAKVSLITPAGAGKNGGAILRVSGMPQPVAQDVYEVWAKRGDKVSPVSLFQVSTDGNGFAAIPDKLDGVDAIYITREKRGGADVPTEKPLASVTL
jgi:anti-sigma-K factor RskA